MWPEYENRSQQGHRVNLEHDNNYIALKGGDKKIPLQIYYGCPVFTIWRKRIDRDKDAAVFARRDK